MFVKLTFPRKLTLWFLCLFFYFYFLKPFRFVGVSIEWGGECAEWKAASLDSVPFLRPPGSGTLGLWAWGATSQKWRHWYSGPGSGIWPEAFSQTLGWTSGFWGGFVLVAATAQPVREDSGDTDQELALWPRLVTRSAAPLSQPCDRDISLRCYYICVSHHVSLFVLASKKLRAKFIACLSLLGWPSF